MPYTKITDAEFAKLVGRHGIVGACMESWRAMVAQAWNDVLDANDRPNHRRQYFADLNTGEFRIREDVSFGPGDDVHAADYIPEWWGIELSLGMSATYDGVLVALDAAFQKRDTWEQWPRGEGWLPALAPESPEVAKANAAAEARAKERKFKKDHPELQGK